MLVIAGAIGATGQAMELTAMGTGLRRSLVFIIHDSLKPPTMMETTWKPKGRCT